uniref:Uncharacterized protein n=1 Tax=Arion vulgaris TaxID=1028688 RepID=A0A0B7A4Y0_9EUPU
MEMTLHPYFQLKQNKESKSQVKSPPKLTLSAMCNELFTIGLRNIDSLLKT